MCRDLHGRDLEVEEHVSEVLRNAELGEPVARFLRQVVRHLEVDVVGCEGLLARPALLDDLDQLVGDVDAPAILPAVLEPAR